MSLYFRTSLKIKLDERIYMLPDCYFEVRQVTISWKPFLILSPSVIFAVHSFRSHFSQTKFKLVKWNVLNFDQILTDNNLWNFMNVTGTQFDAHARRWSLSRWFFHLTFFRIQPRKQIFKWERNWCHSSASLGKVENTRIEVNNTWE